MSSNKMWELTLDRYRSINAILRYINEKPIDKKTTDGVLKSLKSDGGNVTIKFKKKKRIFHVPSCFFCYFYDKDCSICPFPDGGYPCNDAGSEWQEMIRSVRQNCNPRQGDVFRVRVAIETSNDIIARAKKMVKLAIL